MGKKPLKSRQELKSVKRFLIKLGSSVVSREDGGGVALPRISSIVEQIAKCQQSGIECVLVSSGAVAFGKKIISQEFQKAGKPMPDSLSLSQKRAAAALGQPGLMSLYGTLFSEYNINVAQVLILNTSMADEEARSVIKSTVNELLSLNVTPILNTNDAVNIPDSSKLDYKNEPQLYDNDILSVNLASDLGCEVIILATDVDGVYDKPPSDPESILLKNININSCSKNIQFKGTSNIGTGGMESKASAASYALNKGVTPIICSGSAPNFLTSLFKGEDVGTFFYK